MKKKFRLANYRFAPGCVRFINYRGYSQSHSRKIARENNLEEAHISSYFECHSVNADGRGSVVYSRKGGAARYSLPAPQPRIFRGHK